MMRTDQRRKRPMRIRYTNRGKCLLCYLIAFSLPLVWQYAALTWIYPYKLAATAPDLAISLPFFLVPADASLQALLAARESNWLALVKACALLTWALILLMQLLWRFSCRRASSGLRATQRAIHTYRLMMLLVWAGSALFACALWQAGVRLIAGRTLWDVIVYFVFYLLVPFAAAITSRLAAPSVISGRRAFFKRL